MSLSSRVQIPSQFKIPDSGKLLLAFSGGSDSLCLMYLLSIAYPERCEALYVNHRIREDSELDREISLNLENASKLNIPLHIVSLERGAVESLSRKKNVGVESAARELRYKELIDFAKANNFSYILTAHHREDQIETILMRILQNSPFYTYRGILREDGLIYRPLLDLSKKEILQILEESGLEWSEDSTNSDDSYLRNSIRHNLSDRISEQEKAILLNIAENVALIRRAEPCYELGKNAWISGDRESFIKLPVYVRESVLYEAFSHLGISGRVRRSFIRDIYEKIERGSGRFSTDDADFFFLKDSFRIYKRNIEFAFPFSLDTKLPGLEILSERKDDKDLEIDVASLIGPAVIRTSREGDRIFLKNGMKMISDLERENHVPYSIVLEDRNGIAAFFSRFLGGKDRLSERLLGRTGVVIRIEFV